MFIILIKIQFKNQFGYLSGIRKLSEKYNLVQITSPISPGSSGEPLLDSQGRVIGISTFTLHDSQNLNFAIPSNAVLDLKSKNMKWEPQISSISKQVKSSESVVLSFFEKESSEFKESIGIKNNSSLTIKNIKGLMLYYDEKGNPLSYQLISLDDVLPPGMSKLITVRSFDQEQRFCYKYGKDNYRVSDYEFTVKFRLLDYEIIESDFMDKLIGN